MVCDNVVIHVLFLLTDNCSVFRWLPSNYVLMWHFLLGKCFKGIHSLLIFIWRFWRHGWPGKDNDQGLQVWCKYCSVIHVLGCFLAPLLKQVDTDTADRPQQCFIRKQCSISKKNLLKKTQKRLCQISKNSKLKCISIDFEQLRFFYPYPPHQ